MAITIQESTNADYNPTLKLSRLLPAESVILCKNEYESPKEGTSQLTQGGVTKTVPWHLYQVAVKSYTAIDINSGDKIVKNFEDGKICSLFANKTVHAGLEPVPLNVDVKITAKLEQGPKGEFTKYVVTPLTELEEGTTSSTTNPDVSMDEKIKGLKANGVDVDTVVQVISAQYNSTEDFIRKRYEAL